MGSNWVRTPRVAQNRSDKWRYERLAKRHGRRETTETRRETGGGGEEQGGVRREIGGVNILKKYASQLCLFLEFTSIVAHPFPATRHGRAGARGMKPTTGLDAVLHVVPAVEHAFGYGSGVFAQPLASSSWDLSLIPI